MELLLDMVEVPTDREHLRDTCDQLNSLRGYILGFGLPTEVFWTRLAKFKHVQPRARPGVRRGNVTNIELTMGFDLSYLTQKSPLTLVVSEPALDELVSVYLMQMRAEQGSLRSPWKASEHLALYSDEAIVRLNQVIPLVKYGLPTWPQGQEAMRAPISPLEALYYSCQNRKVPLIEHMQRIEQYLCSATGSFSGWRGEAELGRYQQQAQLTQA